MMERNFTMGEQIKEQQAQIDRYERILDSLRAYHDAHPALFTPALNALIIRTVDSIAHAFSGVNKAESQLLHDIHVLLGH